MAVAADQFFDALMDCSCFINSCLARGTKYKHW